MRVKTLRSLLAALAFAPVAFSSPTHAATITNGFTFAVADAFGGAENVGTHFHSNTGGAFGNLAGKAEVGGFFGSEVVRGLSEYDIGSLAAGGPAFVTFNVFLTDGLFGQGGGVFNIDVYSYTGNNTEDLSDYQAPSAFLIGSFSTSGLAVGNVLSFDVAAALDAALSNGDSSFGIRLQASGARNPSGPAFTFDSFRLTTDNQCTGSACQVPEPSSVLLTGLALATVILSRRRQTTRVLPN